MSVRSWYNPDAIGTERRVHDRLIVTVQSRDLRTACGVPDLQQGLLVAAEGGGLDAASRVPKTRCAIPRRGNQASTILAEGSAGNRTMMARQKPGLDTAVGVP